MTGLARSPAHTASDHATKPSVLVSCSLWAILSQLTRALRLSSGCPAVRAVAGLRLRDTHVQQTSPRFYGHTLWSYSLPFLRRTTRRSCPTGMACAAQTLSSLSHTRTLATKPAHVLRCATASATTHRISNIRLAPLRAVWPVGSSGGDTSQTSPPMSCNPRNPRSITCASRMLNPPGSGAPVPICSGLQSKLLRTAISAFSGPHSLHLSPCSGPHYLQLRLQSAAQDCNPSRQAHIICNSPGSQRQAILPPPVLVRSTLRTQGK